MVASGFAGLGYQIVWTQQCALWLGHESAAVLAVVAAFFGGLAVGALALGARIAAQPAPRALVRRLRAGHRAVGPAAAARRCRRSAAGVLRLIGRRSRRRRGNGRWRSAARSCCSCPPPPRWAPRCRRWSACTASSAGAASSDRVHRRRSTPATRSAPCSACSPRRSGWSRGSASRAPRASASRSTCCAASASLLVFPARAAIAPRRTGHAEHRLAPGARGCCVRLALTGLLGIGYEVLVVRVLEPGHRGHRLHLRDAARRLPRRQRRRRRRLPALAGRATRSRDGSADRAARRARRRLPRRHGVAVGAPSDRRRSRSQALGGGVRGGRRGRGGAGARRVRAADGRHGRAVQPPRAIARPRPASASGARWASTRWARRPRRRCSACWRCRSLGPKLALLLIGLGYLALTARRAWSRPVVWAPAGAALALALFAPPLAFVDVPDGGRVVSYRDGVDGRGQRGRGRGRRRPAAHQQPPAGRQQRHAFASTPGRRGCRCCCTRRPRARCSSASAPASPPARRPRTRRCRSTPSSCCPR